MDTSWYYFNEEKEEVDIQKKGVCFNCEAVNAVGESLVSVSISYKDLVRLYRELKKRWMYHE